MCTHTVRVKEENWLNHTVYRTKTPLLQHIIKEERQEKRFGASNIWQHKKA